MDYLRLKSQNRETSLESANQDRLAEDSCDSDSEVRGFKCVLWMKPSVLLEGPGWEVAVWSFVEVESLCTLSTETESVIYLVSPGKGMAVIFPRSNKSHL